MSNFVLPNDFAPTLNKTYNVDTNHPFDIWLENKGLQPEQPGQAPHLLWIFAILVDHKIVEAGSFRWDPSDRHLTDLAVANNLATFYGLSEQVISGKPIYHYPSYGTKLDDLVEKCRSYMFQTFYEVSGPAVQTDFDIHIAEINDTGWEVMLSMANRPNTMYQFSQKKDSPKVEVSTHVKAHTFWLDSDIEI